LQEQAGLPRISGDHPSLSGQIATVVGFPPSFCPDRLELVGLHGGRAFSNPTNGQKFATNGFCEA
jgi:hypothetical protein